MGREVYNTIEDMRFCKLGSDKRPFEMKWNSDKNKFYTFNQIKDEDNYGVLFGGPGNYLCIDIDKHFESNIKVIEKHTNISTLIIESGGSTADNKKYHMYYKIKGDTENFTTKTNINGVDFLYKSMTETCSQAVGAGCLHKSGKKYEVIVDAPIAEVTLENIRNIIQELKPEQDLDNIQDFEGLVYRDDVRIRKLLMDSNMQDMIANQKNISKNKTLFPNIAGFLKYNPNLTEAAMVFVEKCGHIRAELEGWMRKGAQINKKQLDAFFEIFEEVDERFEDDSLNIKGVEYFMGVNRDKQWLIKSYMQRNTFTIVAAIPGGGKSLLTLYESICVASGRNFCGYKTEKSKVLYLDNENNDDDVRDRLQGVMKGMDIKLNELKDWHLLRVASLNEEIVVKKIQRYVEKNNIKYVIIDTKRSHFGGDENKVEDTTRVTQFCNHLKTEYGLTVKLLHHTLKGNKGQYAGSGALESNCDTMIIPTIENIDINELESRISLNFANENNKIRSQKRKSIEMFNIFIKNKMYMDSDGDEEFVIDTIEVSKVTPEQLEEYAEASSKTLLMSNTSFGDEYTAEQLCDIIKTHKPDWKDNTIRAKVDEIKDDLFEVIRTEDRGKKVYKKRNDLSGGL